MVISDSEVMSDSEGKAYFGDREICLKSQDLSTRSFHDTIFKDRIACKIDIVRSINCIPPSLQKNAAKAG